MAQSFILAIDQGTTGTSCALVDEKARIVAAYTQEFQQHYPQPGWVEHRPDQVWRSVQQATHKVLQKSRIRAQQIAGIGITNQRESVVVWDSLTHRPLHNILVWQDTRTATHCQQLKNQQLKTQQLKSQGFKSQKLKTQRLKSQGLEAVVRRKTGLFINPYFSATKLAWLFKNVPQIKKQLQKKQSPISHHKTRPSQAGQSQTQQLQKGSLRVGTIDTYLLWQLTGGRAYKTDVSNASRTLLFDIDKLQWSPDLLKIFGLPAALLQALPECVGSSQVMGYTRGLKLLPDGIPIASMVGDQQAALFGQRCFKKGEAKCTFGTGSFILMNTGSKPVRSKNLLSTVAWQVNKKTDYALEGGAFVCGAAVQWLRDALGVIQSSAEVEKLALQVPSTEGVVMVPAFTGLGAPYWRPDVRASIMGLTRGSTKCHIARATLEAMALQNVDILAAMQSQSRTRLKSLKVDGGAAANNLLMQMQSDFLACSLQRPAVVESTLMGAALLAGLGVGLWPRVSALPKVVGGSSFKPQLNPAQRRQKLNAWQQALKRVRAKV